MYTIIMVIIYIIVIYIIASNNAKFFALNIFLFNFNIFFFVKKNIQIHDT